MKQQEKDRWLLARCRDAIRLGEKSPQFVGFLDEREVVLARQVLQEEGCENARLWGGYEGAERQMLGVFPDYWPASEEEFPIAAVTVRYRREDSLSHRDFLGAFLGAGVQRAAIGDILPDEGRCVLFLKEDTAPFLLSQIEKIGRVGVSLQRGCSLPLPQAHGFLPIEGIIASERLDCAAACLLGTSREKASVLIRTGMVQLNHRECTECSREIHEGDLLSVRSKGRFCIDRLGPVTKKGRICLAGRKYR